MFDEICTKLAKFGFVATFLTKFAFFDERKMAFWRQNLAEI